MQSKSESAPQVIQVPNMWELSYIGYLVFHHDHDLLLHDIYIYIYIYNDTIYVQY